MYARVFFFCRQVGTFFGYANATRRFEKIICSKTEFFLPKKKKKPPSNPFFPATTKSRPFKPGVGGYFLFNFFFHGIINFLLFLRRGALFSTSLCGRRFYIWSNTSKMEKKIHTHTHTLPPSSVSKVVIVLFFSPRPAAYGKRRSNTR